MANPTLSQKKQAANLGHLPWLDWIRFLAAGLVLVVHARGEFLVEFGDLPDSQRSLWVALFYALTRLGNEAVIVFFVLSGYLVGGRTASRVHRGDFDLTKYTVDRFVRIYLPYIPALLLTFICTLLLGIRIPLSSFVVNLLNLQGVLGAPLPGNVPLWSVAYEVWFYILAGALASIFSGVRNGRWVFLSYLLLVCCLAIFTVLSSAYLYCWLFGAAAYFIRRTGRVAVTASIFLVAMSAVGIEARSLSHSINLGEWVNYLPPLPVLQAIFAGGVAFILSGVVKLRFESKIVSYVDRLGRPLAAFSYSLYLTHYPILLVVEHFILPRRPNVSYMSLASLALGCVIAFVVALAMYVVFERQTEFCKRYIFFSLR